jgi:hypothetical protein
MSRLDELKKQYPELNISFFDLMKKLDTSKSYKYLPLICKLFSKRFDVKQQFGKDDYSKTMLEVQSALLSRNISTNNLTDNQMYILWQLSDYQHIELFTTLKDFIYYMEKNQIENNDVTSYSSVEEMRGAVTLASIKEFDKEMSNQIIREYEDETWIAVRPLTFGASAKYGAGTRWCTTYQKEKNYFERYWRQGILVYFINKKTGYKFAGFKSLQDKEMSFWNSNDSRVDYLDVEIDDYMFSKVKKIFSSEFTNKNLCSDEIQEQVHNECIHEYEKMMVTEQEVSEPLQPNEARVLRIDEDVMENQAVMEERIVRTMNITPVPVYEEPTLIRG